MKRYGVWAGVAVFLLSFAAYGQSIHKYDPVVIQGSHLPAVLGSKPSNLRLFAYDGKNFQPVIYQIDERYEEEMYWQWTRRRREMVYVLSTGPVAKADPDPNFDRDDELAFMSWDAGQKAPEGAGPAGAKACQEIKVTDPDTKESSYAYLCNFDNPPPAKEGAYVYLGGDANQFVGKTYKISYAKGKPLFFDQLQLGPKEKLSPNLIDRFKWNLEVQAAFAIIPFALTNDDAPGALRGIKIGPVRIIKEVVEVIEGWPHTYNRLLNHIYYYPCHMEWETETRAPVNWGPIHNYIYSRSIDMNPIVEGAKFYSEKNQKGVTIDGITDEDELKMDYGPQEWAAVSTKWGTIYNHLALPTQAKNLYRDLYYADMVQKPDAPESYPGEFGKFGFTVRNLEKTGRKPVLFREIYFFSPDQYQPGAEKPYIEMYKDPLTVESGQNSGYAVNQSLPSREEDRSAENMPVATNAPKLEKKQTAQYPSPNIYLDPVNTGYGGGVAWYNDDIFHTGMGWDISTTYTTRSYYDFNTSFYKLKFLTFFDSTEIYAGLKQFPCQAFWGIGDNTKYDHEVIYWWTRQEADLRFKKHFFDHYGVDTIFFYRNSKIKSGQQPIEGTQVGKPSFEDHYGINPPKEKYGGPLWGRQGGYTNGFSVTFYRDMRDEPDVPHHGDYESLQVYRVGPELFSDYEYTKLSIDLRKYFEPSWLQDLPMDRWFNAPHGPVAYFFGPSKHRSLMFRVIGTHTFSNEFNYGGQKTLDVPFWDLTGLGGGGNNRGFNGGRFQDYDLFGVSLEYRWQYWRFFDTALFLDSGLVMHDMTRSKDWENPWRTSFGVAVRAHVPPVLILTFEYSFSPESPSGMLTQSSVY